MPPLQSALVNRDGASADISIISTNVADGSTAIVTADTSSITVTYDAECKLVFEILQVDLWDLATMLPLMGGKHRRQTLLEEYHRSSEQKL